MLSSDSGTFCGPDHLASLTHSRAEAGNFPLSCSYTADATRPPPASVISGMTASASATRAR